MKILQWKKTDPPKFDNVPEKPGIYIISTRQEVDGQYEVKYIGQTDNLRSRANEHWSKKETNTELKAHLAEEYAMKFNYAEVALKPDREGMLLYMHQVYDPPFNPKAPLGEKVVKCTLPESVRKQIKV